MLETADESPRLTIVFLPAMLCDDELYRPQIEGLRDLVEPVVLTVAEPTMQKRRTPSCGELHLDFCSREPPMEGALTTIAYSHDEPPGREICYLLPWR